MNRRQVFKGLAAALVAASVPLPIQALVSLPNSEIISYLKRVRLDLLYKITNPPCIMSEDGKIEIMPTDVWVEALRHVTNLLTELGQ